MFLLLSVISLTWGQKTDQGTGFKLLYAFSGGDDGEHPVGPPAIAPGPVLFVATSSGGTSRLGTIFKLTPPTRPGGSWNESVLYSFQGAPDGATPNGVVIARSGALLGTTRSGGANDRGAVFELKPPSQIGGTWSESIIHSFGSGTDGALPYAGLTRGLNGTFFGTTLLGGTQNKGAVFGLIPSPYGGEWLERVVFNFTASENPLAPLTFTRGGVLLGTGSGDSNPYTPSSSFALIPPAMVGEQWIKVKLYDFPGATQAESPLLIAGKRLIGTTIYGGTDDAGTVYELTPSAVRGEPWKETILYSFPGLNGGPSGRLVGGAKRIFGSTSGSPNTPQAGSVFALSPPTLPGRTWSSTLLHSFNAATDGSNPSGGLSIDVTGTLYGVTQSGGPNGIGTVFALTRGL